MNIDAKLIGVGIAGLGLAGASAWSFVTISKKMAGRPTVSEDDKDLAAIGRNIKLASIGGFVTGVAAMAHAVVSTIKQS